MRPFVLLTLSALALVHSSLLHALDCQKASLPVEKLFCATPELKQADEAMSAAYFKTLRDTTDPDFHEALTRSQRRWLEVRSHGVDKFGAAERDQTDDRQALLQVTRDRLAFLQTGVAIRTMERQRRIMAQDGGGPFAGYDSSSSYHSSCFFSPPPYDGWRYVCPGVAHRQHDERICSVATEWASGHVTERRLVSVVKRGQPEPVASCSTGHADVAEQCPESDDGAATKAAHWKTSPPASDDLPIPPAKGQWKYDPDFDPSIVGQPWMSECLFAQIFPPPARPNSPRDR